MAQKNNGLVPPPPPYIPQFTMPMPQQGAFQQQPPMTLAPPVQPKLDPTGGVPLPQAPNTQAMLSGPSEADLSTLRGYSNAQNRFAQMRMQQYGDNPNPFPTVGQMPQSDFDQVMQQRLQGQIMQSLDSQNSPGDRFGKGFDAGQQLAASVVIPAIGSFGSGNDAIGTLAASQMMQDNLKGRQAQRSANKQALNNSLINLSSLYENVSPQSAKNIAALMKMNMERQKMNLDYQNKVGDDVMSALKGSGDATARLMEIQSKAGEQKATAAGHDFNNNLSVAKEQNSQNNSEFGQRKDMLGAQNDATKIGMAQDAAALEQQKFDESKRQFGEKQGLAQNQFQANSTNQLLTRLAQPMALDAAVGNFGGKTHPGILQNYANNPALSQAFQSLGNAAGIQGSPLPAPTPAGAPQAPPASGGLMDWLMPPGQQQGQQGQPPVKIEQVVANPAQFIQFDQKQNQMLANASKNPAQAAAVLAPAIRAQLAQRGMNPTESHIAQILNSLVR